LFTASLLIVYGPYLANFKLVIIFYWRDKREPQ